MMTTLTPGAVGADTTPTPQVGPKLPKLKLVKFRKASTMTRDCFFARLKACRSDVTYVNGLGGTRMGIQIKNPGSYFDLETLERDCLLKENASYCPGSSGTIAHTYLGDRETLCLDSSHESDVIQLLFNHRLSDLDPPAPAA